jgi:hypothetical protein
MTTKEVIIKPVVKPKFSGISSYSRAHYAIEGAQLGKSGYKTGITEEEQKYFEKALRKPEGFLNPDNKEFWATMLGMNLPLDKPFFFSVTTPLDELKLKVILQRSDIANNELELQRNPSAVFFIEDKEAKAKVEELAIDILMVANEAFNELTIDEKKGYLKLYGKKGVEDLSDRIIKTELYKEVNKDPKKFIDFTKNPDIALRIQIEEMLEQGTLTKKGSFYNFEQEVIGNSIDAVVAFFKDVKNQSVKIAAIQVTKQNKKKG